MTRCLRLRLVRRVGFVVVAALVGAVSVVAPAASGAAGADPVTVCSGTNCTVTFAFVPPNGAPQNFVVPACVAEITVDATGGAGGTGASGIGTGGIGGQGISAIGTLGVTPGETLRVHVGGNGGNASAGVGGAGGFNGGGGGGAGTAAGGGGGGASDIRRGPLYTMADRLIVAAGGGGGGSRGVGGVGTFNGGAGGPGGGGSGASGGSGEGSPAPGGGAGGTNITGGGSGGIGTPPAPNGSDGASGAGGGGGIGTVAGGGGGGGWFGGGGGGAGYSGRSGAGGGGGSSQGPSGTTVTLRSPAPPAGVTITYDNACGTVSGTVSEAGTGTPVAGAWVAVLRTSDFSIAAGAVAEANGDYSTQVAPGAYYLYVVDPAGAHTAGFHGPPTLVTVTANHTVDADPAMAATRGSISGIVTEDHTLTDQTTSADTPGTAVAGIAGAWAVALSTNPANTGAPETAVIADDHGRFTIPALNPRTHYLGYVDPTGDHATRFYTHSPNVPDATPVPVTAGNTTVADGALPPQQGTHPDAPITGTVLETGTDTPLPDIYVMALHAADYRIARGAVTDTHGEYTLDVEEGGYKLAYIDSTGRHNMEWHDNRANHDLAHADTVTAPAETKADLDPNTGTMAGTIVDDPAATPVAGAWVIAIAPTGIAAGAVTAANGTYTLPGLTPGTYRATFVDPNGGRTQEYFDNSPTYPGATTINITAAATTTINAALHHP